MLTYLVAAILLAPGGQQFNLECSGTLTSWSDLEGVRTTKPFAATYHIDLQRRVWCQDACQDARRILATTADDIVLLRSEERGAVQHLIIDRATDRLRSDATLEVVLGSLHVEIDAPCTRAEYGLVPRTRPRPDRA